MSAQTSIEWTETTWNPVTGCIKVSPGCKHCYAERMARRLQAMGQPRYANGFAVTMQEDAIEEPLSWRQPRTVFVNSMSDLFHVDVPDAYIADVFDVMQRMSDDPLTACIECGATVQKVLNAPAIHFQGSGFYNTDYGRRNGSKSSESSGSEGGATALPLRGASAPSSGAPGRFQRTATEPRSGSSSRTISDWPPAFA